MSQRTHPSDTTRARSTQATRLPPRLRAVAVVLALVLTLGMVTACGGGAAAGAIVGAAAGAAIGSTFDDPYCCDGGGYDDPYYYATDPVAHDDTW